MTIKKRTVIFGARLHAAPVLELVQLSEGYEATGFIDSNPALKGKKSRGIPVLGDDSIIPELKNMGIQAATLGLGYEFREQRECLFNLLKDADIEVPNFIHPRSIVSNSVNMKEGIVVMAGATINPYCEIGDLCVINTNCSLDHDCTLGDHVFVSPGVSIGGKVSVGKGTFIGIGASVIDKLTIGKDSYLGAGSVVIKDIPDNVMVYGNPAKVIREYSG